MRCSPERAVFCGLKCGMPNDAETVTCVGHPNCLRPFRGHATLGRAAQVSVRKCLSVSVGPRFV